jgi:hypothetical protein|tara:strand:- start:905 stop:1426 length:522 start_codon:yes stop_codon:yes gene_type:complete
MLKGQDIALVMKIMVSQQLGRPLEYAVLAYELYISQSEVSKGMLRLEKAKIISRYPDKGLEVHKHALFEMLVHGLKYFMTAELNIEQRGTLTAYSSPCIKQKIVNQHTYVWPYINGQDKGISLTPLYKTLPKALDRFPDESFHELMSLLDLMRLGGSREIKIASEMLEKKIWA